MKKTHLLLNITCILGLAACANNPFSSYHAKSNQTINKIYQGQLTTAMVAESTADPLYNMEYGSLERMNQSYTASNYNYTLAEQSIQLWANSWMSTTGGNIANSATSMLINDNATEYQPKGYEKSFLATYHALNHLDLNNWENARIEIKRMYQIEQATKNYNQALYYQTAQEYQDIAQDKSQSYLENQIIQNYDFSDINKPEVLALKNSYQNAFSHYLAGFIFEAMGEPSLARPGYVNAGQLNPTNTLIQQSISNLDKNYHPKAGYSDLLIIEEVGHAPLIKSQEAHIPINANFTGNQNSCINMINIFFPTLQPDRYNNMVYPYLLDSNPYTPLEMVDVNLMAARAIHDEIPHLIARNISAAIRNIATSQAACGGGGNIGTLLSLGTSLGGMLLDRADERTWTLLPNKIFINRVSLPYGKHNITVNVNGIPFTQEVTLTQPYQIVNFRIIGNQVLFNTQQ